MPGGDPFKKKKDEPPKKSSDEIFQKPTGAGGGAGAASAKLKAEEKAKKELERESEDYFKKNDKVKDPEPPPKPVVVLSHPKWGGEQGIFGWKIKASVEGAIPKEIEHRTKVTFTVFALPPNGERDRIGSKDEHIRNGIAEVEVDLWHPHAKGPGGEPLASCPYIFEVKHSCSKVATSEPLQVMVRKSPRLLYEARLKEAVRKLRHVDFGRAEGSRYSENPEGRYGKFDERYWNSKQERKIDGHDEGVLEVKSDESYPDAIIAIVENPDLWKLDCWQFVQVCNLYALIDPDNKGKFLTKIEQTLKEHKRDDFKTGAIRTFSSWVQLPFESTGLKITKAYSRPDPKSKWKVAPEGGELAIDVDAIVKAVPIGSRVSWSIKGATEKNAYRTENAIKMGNDQFAAHNFIAKESGPTGFLSRAKLEALMLREAGWDSPGEVDPKDIFISDIAEFEVQ